MKAFITYAELEEIIRKKAGLSVKLNKVSEDTVKVVSDFVSVLGLHFKIYMLSANNVAVEISIGKLNGIIGWVTSGNAVSNKIEKFLEHNNLTECVTFDENSKLKFNVRLDKIEQLSKVMKTVEVERINFEDNAATVEVNFI